MFNRGGGMLTGHELEKQIRKGNITITPYDPSRINPNSYNLTLHPQLLVYKRGDARENILYTRTSFPVKYGEDMLKPESKKEVQDNVSEMTDQEIIDVVRKDETKVSTNGILKVARLASRSELCSVSYAVTTVQDKLNEQSSIIDKKIHNNWVDINNLETNSINSSTMLEPIDMMKENETIEFTIPEEGFVLQPGVLYIGRTVERTSSDKFIPMINGRSSGGRLGISIHICAGFGDVGFDGTWTLEITCVEPVRIYPNVPIAQVCYFKPYGKIKNLYRGRYYQQEDATPSRFFKKKGEPVNYDS